ncbi:MAG: prepilin-type N-terminal cleavage/methylation domain-containing protein, partial [Betaproteobacteria bacterium]|nr:prepilin-type N-terminal cleavage/methylation domain-containing protein [Betaproteobacteria bacterium]
MKTQQKGFTLVEIAIVLVIIGLLLGGILKGQEMITQAKIKNVIADFSGISAAYHGYQDRYRAIPGDDLNATRWTGATAGSGNGVVAGTYADTTANVESRLWWDHLRRAGF